jgi:hypothetical protein
MKRTETWFSNTFEATLEEVIESPQAPTPTHQSFVISVIKNIALLLAVGAIIGILTAIAFTLYQRIAQDEDNLPTEIAHVVTESNSSPSINSSITKRHKVTGRYVRGVI